MAKGTPEHLQLLLIKDHIASLPPAEQQVVNAAAETIRCIVRSNGDFGPLAVALVGSELAADEF